MTTEDWKSLNAFLLTCRQMSNSGFGKQFRIAPTKTYRLQENTPHSTRVHKKIVHDEWQAFLIPFRKLILNDEPGNLLRILNILSRLGSKSDQIRIREIKRRLKEVETSQGYGVTIGVKVDSEWKTQNGRKLLEKYINSLIFHNDPDVIVGGEIEKELHTFSLLPLFHYVIFTYKQALRIGAAIQIRYGA